MKNLLTCLVLLLSFNLSSQSLEDALSIADAEINKWTAIKEVLVAKCAESDSLQQIINYQREEIATQKLLIEVYYDRLTAWDSIRQNSYIINRNEFVKQKGEAMEWRDYWKGKWDKCTLDHNNQRNHPNCILPQSEYRGWSKMFDLYIAIMEGKLN